MPTIRTAKNDEGKPRLDLIHPKALMSLGAVLAHGAKIYAPYGWKEEKDGRAKFYAAALRHLLAWKSGETHDKSSRLPHLSHAMANVMFLFGLSVHDDEAGRPVDG
jgi:hypothetical protein